LLSFVLGLDALLIIIEIEIMGYFGTLYSCF